MSINRRPLNPKSAKLRARGSSFWRRVRDKWRQVPLKERTPERYADLFSDQAGLLK